MPSGHPNQGRRNEGFDRNNGGHKAPAPSFVENVKGRAETVTNRLQEGYSAVREEAGERYRQAGEIVSGNPATSVFVGLGLGFGIGLVLSTMLGRREETWAERYLPSSLLDIPNQLQKSRLANSLRHAPDSFQGSFDHLSETLRDLPAAISRVLPKH